MFVWEFKHDRMHMKKIDVKYYALDEILAFIGGNLSLIISIVGIFFLPFS